MSGTAGMHAILVNQIGTLAACQTLPDDEVQVWCLSLDLPDEVLEPLAQTLSPDEQARAARLRFEHHRRQFIASHGLLRGILGNYLAHPPASLHFGREPGGKPVLKQNDNGRELRFNMSHAQEVAMYAVAWDRAIGIDIEHIRPMPDAAQIVARFFSPTERNAWSALPKEQQLGAFFDSWTRKEAYLKATGAGLAQPLESFSVSLAPGEPARLLEISGDQQAATRWDIQMLDAPAGYAAALCVEGTGWKRRLRY
jgi:4'-phosphopantetheinyl transferase